MKEVTKKQTPDEEIRAIDRLLVGLDYYEIPKKEKHLIRKSLLTRRAVQKLMKESSHGKK